MIMRRTIPRLLLRWLRVYATSYQLQYSTDDKTNTETYVHIAFSFLFLFLFSWSMQAWAGGNATAFQKWPSSLPDTVELCALQLPGRMG